MDMICYATYLSNFAYISCLQRRQIRPDNMTKIWIFHESESGRTQLYEWPKSRPICCFCHIPTIDCRIQTYSSREMSELMPRWRVAAKVIRRRAKKKTRRPDHYAEFFNSQSTETALMFLLSKQSIVLFHLSVLLLNGGKRQRSAPG